MTDGRQVISSKYNEDAEIQGNRFGLYHESIGQKYGSIKDDLAKMRENLQNLNHKKFSKTKASTLLGDRRGKVGTKLLSHLSVSQIDENSDREMYPIISAAITDIP